ncbi:MULTISPECIES: flagellar hook-basal body complex protein FliE [unclassified Serratia (in: enterobacteria)]|uniref:flagellar hook-basal body complex protein FliE n=1 Tax=unclassified Serratia (in: enterobacteria) TaxID=2647522 RepID=UPI000505FA7B|nr:MULTISPECIES: flagellar hook-basal body complex protein FliE [unclassified Serratia (in: enterobacteria)]KFK93575.1 flagellar hook-basal body protein FliE [Serratia sp. Ag2]KFK93860.1 flagellar hook-basal body protein FliE [Serratia sp. Ag1]
MTIHTVAGIAEGIQRLQATAFKASNEVEQAVSGASFASELKAALGKISDTQLSARQQAQDFALGVPDVSLNDVMVDLQKSSVSLQLGVQVRNKLVAAYQDVMNMAV